jgi:hypothetical protein
MQIMNINYPIQLLYIPLVAKHKDNTHIVLHYEEIRFSYIIKYYLRLYIEYSKKTVNCYLKGSKIIYIFTLFVVLRITLSTHHAKTLDE